MIAPGSVGPAAGSPDDSPSGCGAAPDRPGFWGLVGLGLASRVAVVALGCLLARVEPAPKVFPDAVRDPVSHRVTARQVEAARAGPARGVSAWYRFDAAWYAEIAERGYAYQPGSKCTAAFLPLLPMAMAGGERLGLDRFWVGLVVPGLAFAVGLGWFGRVAARLTGDPATARRACLLLVAYPWSFFFAAPYGEALGFACLTGAALAWLDGRPARAALGAFPASLARLSALALPAAVLAEAAVDRLRGRVPRRGAWAVALAGVAGVALFFLYLGGRFGEPLAHLDAHRAWERRPASLAGLAEGVRLVVEGGRYADGLSRLVVVAAVGLGLDAWRRHGAFWGVLTLMPIAQALATGSLMSIDRVALASFPAFIAAAERLRHAPAATAALAAGMAALQVCAIDDYVNFVFVG